MALASLHDPEASVTDRGDEGGRVDNRPPEFHDEGVHQAQQTRRYPHVSPHDERELTRSGDDQRIQRDFGTCGARAIPDAEGWPLAGLAAGPGRRALGEPRLAARSDHSDVCNAKVGR